MASCANTIRQLAVYPFGSEIETKPNAEEREYVDTALVPVDEDSNPDVEPLEYWSDYHFVNCFNRVAESRSFMIVSG